TMSRLAFSLIALSVVASAANAAEYSVTRSVMTLHSQDSAVAGDSDWFTLFGLKSLGTCKVGDAGDVVFLLPNDKEGQRMFAIALASRPAGLRVKPWVDDTIIGASGFCYVRPTEE